VSHFINSLFTYLLT